MSDLNYLLRMGVDTASLKAGAADSKALLGGVGRAADDANARLAKAAKAIDAVGVGSKKAAPSLSALSKGVESIGKHQDPLEALRRLLESMAPAAKKSIRPIDDLGNSVKKTGSLVDWFRSKWDQAANTLTRIALVGGAVSLAFGAVSLTKSAVSDLATLDHALTVTQAVTRGTAEDYRRLEASALEMSDGAVHSATAIAKAQTDLSKAGLSVNEVISAMPDVMAFATAGGIELASATDILTQILRSFHIEASNTSRATDAVAFAANASRASIESMGNAFKFIAPVASSLKIPIEDVSVALAVLSDAGFRGEMGGTALRNILSHLFDTSKKGDKILRDLGLSFKDLDPRANSLVEIFEKLAKAGIEAPDAMNLWKQRGGPAILAMVQNLPRLKELSAELKSSAGITAETAATIGTSLESLGKMFTVAFERTRINFAKAFEGVLEPLGREFLAVFQGSEHEARAWGRSVGAILLVAGNVALVVAKNFDILRISLLTILGVKILQWLQLAISGLVSFATRSSAAAAASGASAAAANVQATALLRVGNVALTTSTKIGVATVGFAALAGVLLLASDRLAQFSAQGQRDIDKMVESTNGFADKINKIKSDLEGFKSPAALDAEFERRLRSVGAQRGSAEGDRIFSEVVRDNQARMVDAWAAQRGELEKANKSLEVLRDRRKQLLADTVAAEQALLSTSRLAEDSDRPAASSAYQDASNKLARLQQELSDTNVRFHQAKIASSRLSSSIEELNRLTKDYKPPPIEYPGDEPDGSPAVDHFGKAKDRIEAETAALLAHAKAQEEGLRAVEEANFQRAIENETRSLSEELTRDQVAALGDLIKALVQARRVSAGSERIASLDRELKAQQDLSAALRVSDQAGEAQRRANEDRLAVEKALVGVAEDQREAIEKKTLALLAGQRAQDFEAQKKQLDFEVASTERLLAAVSKGPDAFIAAAKAEELLAAKKQALTGRTTEEALAISGTIDKLLEYKKVAGQIQSVLDLEKEANFTDQVLAIGEPNDRLRELRIQHLDFLRGLGEGSVEEGQRVFDGLASAFGWSAQQVVDWLEKIDDASRAEQYRGASKTSRDLFDESIGEINRLMKKGLVTAEDGAAAIDATTQDFWSNQLSEWSSGLDYLDSLFGGFLGGLADAVSALSRAQGFGSSVANAAKGLGASAATASSLGYIGVTAAIFAEIYSAVDGHLKRAKLKLYSTWAELKIVDGLISGLTIGDQSHALWVQINGAIDSLEDALGASLTSLPEISIKLRNDGKKVKAELDGFFVGIFDSTEEAINAALAYAITSGKAGFSGLSELMAQAIREGVAGSDLDAIKKTLGQLREIGDLVGGAGAAQLREANRHFDDLWKTLARLTEVTPAVVQGFADLATAEINAWQSWRDSITLREKTPAEDLAERRREALLFNAQRALRVAELQMRLADLRAEQELIKARGRLFDVDKRLKQADIEADKAILDAERKLINSTILFSVALAEAAGGATDILQAQINAINEILKNLPGVIDIGEVKVRPGGGRGGGRQAAAEDAAAFARELEEITRGALPESVQAILSLGDQLREMSERAKELGTSEALLAAARKALIDQTKKSITDPISSFLNPSDGGTYGLSDPDKRAAEIAAEFDAAREANAALLKETGQRAIAFWKLNEAEIRALLALAEDVVDALGLPLESARDRAKALGDNVDFLRKQMESGVISADRFGQVMGELGGSVTQELYGIAADLLEQAGDSKQAAEIRKQLAEAEYDLKIAEMDILFQTATALNLLTAEAGDRIRGIIDWLRDPANRPDFTVPSGGDTRPLYSIPDTSELDNQISDLQDRLADQIREWNNLGIGPVTLKARELKDRLRELTAEAARLNVATDGLAAAYANARQHLLDEALRPFEDLAMSPLERQARDLRDTFLDIRTALGELGGTAQEFGRVTAAETAAFADLWREATQPLADRLAELRQSRGTPRQQLDNAQSEFMRLASLAQGGDLAALEELVRTNAFDRAIAQVQAYYGGAAGASEQIASIEAIMDALLASNPLVNGDGSDPVSNRLDTSNSLLADIRDRVSSPAQGDHQRAVASALRDVVNGQAATAQATAALATSQSRSAAVSAEQQEAVVEALQTNNLLLARLLQVLEGAHPPGGVN